MKCGKVVEVNGRQLTLEVVGEKGPERETLDVATDVFVKLDGSASSLAALQTGDRCECHEHADGTLAVLKVRRKVPDGLEGSTAADSTDGTNSFKQSKGE